MKALEIKREAFVIFAKKGYDATTVNEIAQSAGLKKASFYSHFSSKKELYIELFREQADKYIYMLKGKFEECYDTDLKVVLLEIFKSVAEYFSDKVKLWFWKRALIITTCKSNEEVSAELLKTVKIIDLEFTNSLFELFRKYYNSDRMSDEKIKASIMTFAFLLHGFLDWLAVYEGEDIDAVIESIWGNTIFEAL